MSVPAPIGDMQRSAAMCQQATSELFDYLVGALLKLQRNMEAERLGSLEIDYQLELVGSLRSIQAGLQAHQVGTTVQLLSPCRRNDGDHGDEKQQQNGEHAMPD
jgi:hypothetical protein